MSTPDLNLLVTLDVLLREGSVARAARHLRLSPSAMSRALARLRAATGDPLLVRAGRGLVPTPRALELRAEVGDVVSAAQAILRPAKKLDLKRLSRTFTLRTGEGFVENFGPALVALVQAAAPGLRLSFVPKVDRDSVALREGSVDLETGVIAKVTGPEIRAQALMRDRFVGVVRKGHPLARGRLTPARYAACRHVGIARRDVEKGPVDLALESLGLARDLAVTVGGFSGAIALARGSDLVASVPERHTGILRAGMHTFPLPFDVPEVTISLLWHPRQDSDPAHHWLRDCVREVCAGGSV
ncbi:LysR family transcriptional regulator [Dongia sp.]|uniref:LysR family transcriptional regulator n=1 Tax=Dongia sp. TaxID=1977262 RepID=UPI0035B08A53